MESRFNINLIKLLKELLELHDVSHVRNTGEKREMWSLLINFFFFFTHTSPGRLLVSVRLLVCSSFQCFSELIIYLECYFFVIKGQGRIISFKIQYKAVPN